MFFKMREKLIQEIEIPKSIEVKVKNNEVVVSNGTDELSRKLNKVIIKKKDEKIVITAKRATKREKKQINTAAAHIKNMLKGLQKKFVYKLEICAIHFPMNISVKDSSVVIKNFLGETKERRAKILDKVEVKIDKNIIEISSADKEAAGQTAANIEKAAKVKNKDKRIFQDGIFIVEKYGRRI